MKDPQLNLATPFHRHCLNNPDSRALFVDGRAYSYADLGRFAGTMATFLVDPGQPVRRVGILASRSLEAVAGILAACWAGVTFVPLSPKGPDERLVSILRSSGVDALIVDGPGSKALTKEVRAACPAVLLAPGMDSQVLDGVPLVGRQTLATQPPMREPAPVAEGDPAYVMFTSGTTGEPNGVVITNGNVHHFLNVSQRRYRLRPDDRLSQQSEITFDHIVFDLFMAWGAGAAVYVVPGTMVMVPAAFIKRHELTVWFSVPSIISFLRDTNLLAPGAFPSLRLSLFAGEPLPREWAEAWQEAAPASRVDNLYGPTEVTVDCLWQSCARPIPTTPARGFVAIGVPYDGMEAAIIDPSNHFLEPGRTGELVVSGPQVAAGYVNNPALTALRFLRLRHPRLGEARWYRTGDLACQDATGIFHYLGRTDNQVKVLGQRVELEDVEFHLRAVTGSDMAAVVGYPVGRGTAEGLIAFLTGKEPDPAQVKELLRRRLPACMIPKRIVHLERMPLSANGKLDRKALAALVAGEGGRPEADGTPDILGASGADSS